MEPKPVIMEFPLVKDGHTQLVMPSLSKDDTMGLAAESNQDNERNAVLAFVAGMELSGKETENRSATASQNGDEIVVVKGVEMKASEFSRILNWVIAVLQDPRPSDVTA